MAKIAIALTSPHHIPAKFLNYFMLIMACTQAHGHQVVLAIDNHYMTSVSRNKCVDIAKKTNSDYIFFLDVDVFAPEDIIIRLLQRDRDIVSGPYHKQNPPYEPQAYKRFPNNHHLSIGITEEKIVEVDAIGAGCMLVKMDVFRKLNEPYFSFWSDETKKHMGEDFTFCKKAKDAGFSIWYDNTISDVVHFGAAVGKKEFLKWQKEWQEKKEKLEKIGEMETVPEN
jgi:GT2 family glycosyltransferase